MNPSYNGHTSTASIGWGVFISPSWGAVHLLLLISLVGQISFSNVGG
jgi:hypothetical protein